MLSIEHILAPGVAAADYVSTSFSYSSAAQRFIAGEDDGT